VHGLPARAATNALEHEADIAKVQQWLGHANISTTRIYARRGLRPEDSPTFKVWYRSWAAGWPLSVIRTVLFVQMFGHGIANNPGGYDKNDDPSYCVYEAHSSRPLVCAMHNVICSISIQRRYVAVVAWGSWLA